MLHALLIGIDHYAPNPWCADLHGAVADVVAMRGYLLSIGVPEGQIRCLVSAAEEGRGAELGERPTWGAMVTAIRELGERSAASGQGALIHYSGHGGRARTWLRDEKGVRGFDEGLVPCDVGSGGGRLLRDIELTWLLDDLVRRGVPVTVLLDSCHSGGMLRTGSRRLRRRSARGLVGGEPGKGELGGLAVGEEPVAPLDELARTWRRVHQRRIDHVPDPDKILRHGRSQGGWVSADLVGNTGVVVVSACRARDYAYERDFGQGPRGALTWHLVDTLEREGRDRPWEAVYRQLSRRMLRLSPPQRPIFEGDGEGAGKGLLCPPAARGDRQPGAAGDPGVWVASRLPEAPRWTLRPRRLRLVEEAPEDPGPAGHRRVLRDGGRRQGPGVLLRREIDRRASELLCWAEDDAVADLLVRQDPQGFTLAWADGQPIPGVPPCPGRGAAAVRRCLAQLEHLARFLGLRDAGLEAVDDDGLAARLLLLPPDYRSGDPLADDLEPLGDGSRVVVGRWIVFEVSNLGRRPLFVSVFDLQPDWGVERLHPRRGVGELGRGRRLRLPFELFLPEGHPGGSETLLALATHEPAELGGLRMPALGAQTVEQGVRRGGALRGRSRSSFGAIGALADFEVMPWASLPETGKEPR